MRAFVKLVLLALAASLGLTCCEESGQVVAFRENFPPREPIPFSLPERRTRQIEIHPETYRFVEAIGKMEDQIAELEASLDEVEELHETYDFDAFLELDPWTVEMESLFYLSHFCDAGFFTVQRKVLLSLLEQKIACKQGDARAALRQTGRKDLEQRLAEAMLDREEHIMNLEQVLYVYDTRQGAQEFLIPDYVTPDGLEAMRAEVAGRLERQRSLVFELDRAIRERKNEFDAL